MLSPKDAFNTLVGWGRFSLEIYNPVTKIIGLVQDNPEFFGAKVGDSAIGKAAETLERLVNKTKESK